MDVFLNKQKISLNQNSFKAAGGEGSIFIKNGIAFKIYADSNKMIPLGKIQELSAITMTEVIKPLDILYNTKGVPVGYTMKALDNIYSLCQIFTKAFRDRNNLKNDDVLLLVQKLQEMVNHIHSKGILIVDLNEMNFLLDDKFQTIYGIDVDSYKTKSFPATAIMPSIEDPHAKRQWTENTDWYSFAIQACQMLIGIHPYKGRHPSIKTFDERMKSNVSIFNKEVQIPGTCQPFDVIPQALRQWMIDVFDKGLRLPPPNTFGKALSIAKVSYLSGSDNYIINELYTLDGDILYFTDNVIVTTKGIFIRDISVVPISYAVRIGFTPSTRQPIAARVENGKLKVLNVHLREEILVDIDAQSLMEIDGRLYIKSGENVYEIELLELGKKIIVKPKVVGNVLPHSTQLFDGVAIQNLLGTTYASIFSLSGTNYQIKLPELTGYRVVDAKYASKVMIVIGEKDGKYNRLVFRFNTDCDAYDIRTTNDVSSYGVNFTVLDNGMVLNMLDNDDLELFSNNKNSQSVKTINDPSLDSSCRLFHHGMTAMFAKENQMFTVKMK